MPVQGARQLQARLRAIKPDAKLTAELALVMLREQKARAPVRTGNLRRSIVLGAVTPRSAQTVARAAYAAAVEYGTRPHTILPRSRKVLKFNVGGREVFARKVNHPGTRPQPFMGPGAAAAQIGRHVRAAIVSRWNKAA